MVVAPLVGWLGIHHILYIASARIRAKLVAGRRLAQLRQINAARIGGP